jgi:hypothetical protein
MVENLRTLAEINRTVRENTIPRGSRIIVKILGECARVIIFHSKSMILQFNTIYSVGSSKVINRSQINLFAYIKISASFV